MDKSVYIASATLSAVLSVHCTHSADTKTEQNLIFTDRITKGGNAIASVRLSIHLFVSTVSYLRKRLTVDVKLAGD